MNNEETITSTTRQKLDIIRSTRAQVMSRRELTGENLFLAWGYPTAIAWLWMGIPLIGTPLMVYFLNEDYERTGCRTLEQNIILVMWIFVGFASGVGGAAMGFVGIFPLCYCAYQGLLVGFGCFMTGIILHFRPKTICGIIASFLSVTPLFLQGDLWPWQLLVASIISVIALIIPGHLFHNYVKKHEYI